MDNEQYGYASGEQAGPAMGHPGCGGSGAQSSGGPTQAGSCGNGGGQSDYHKSSYHTGTGCAGHAQPGMSHSAYMNHPPLHEAYHYGYYPPGAFQAPDAQGYSIFGLNLSDGNFWKGALIGAAVALLVTNDTVQKSIMKGVVSAYSAAQDAVGEMKEKFEDAQAELKTPKE